MASPRPLGPLLSACVCTVDGTSKRAEGGRRAWQGWSSRVPLRAGLLSWLQSRVFMSTAAQGRPSSTGSCSLWDLWTLVCPFGPGMVTGSCCSVSRVPVSLVVSLNPAHNSKSWWTVINQEIKSLEPSKLASVSYQNPHCQDTFQTYSQRG